MKTVELYARVRRAVLVDGMSRRAAAREFGLARKTVHKMLEFSVPPGYQRQKPVRRPKLGPWQGVIAAILEEDKQRPRKQRHTAKRIFDRLRAEQKTHFMAFDLPHSDDCFVQAFPAETTEAFLEADVRAFEYFGGVPTRILYDNTKLAVARILGDGERKKTRAFSELQSHYLFAEKFGRPAKGNDKGKVENLVGYTRRNFMVPIPRAASWEALNGQFMRDAMARRAQRLRGHTETIGERFERDRAVLLPLPAARFEACDKTTVRISFISLVRYRINDYSVPTQYGHRQVLVKTYIRSCR
jgi:transposase